MYAFRSVGFSVLLCALSGAWAAPSVVREVQGSVEQQRGTWTLVKVGDTVQSALRVGTGRATLQSGEGQVLIGSGSALRIYQNEPDLQLGRFYLTGQVAFFSQKAHLASDGAVRLDLSASTQRIAAVSGTARISLGSRLIKLSAGQQYDFGSGQVSAFAERDAWYLARFAGPGEARIEAANGAVTVQDRETVRPGVLNEALIAGQVLQTGAAAWAEVGFTGGGYLRLQAESALMVLSIDKVTNRPTNLNTVNLNSGTPQAGTVKASETRAAQGREITLQLTRGSAWNVVAPGQGGYQITTPTVTTAVRGTIFRVDAQGLVKVFEGEVALPSNGDTAVEAGEQRPPSGGVEPLVLDATDRMNQTLDKTRAEPTQLRVTLSANAPNLALSARSQPDARLSVSVAGEGTPGRKIAVPGNAEGEFALSPDLLGTLPEGRYDVTITAQRAASRQSLRRTVTIDRTPPVFGEVTAFRAGRVLRLSGQVADRSARLLLRAEIDGQTYTRHLTVSQGEDFDWVLPLPSFDAPVRLSATDEAGNTANAAY